MEGDDEDDIESVLKNSELYNYLISCDSSKFEYYDGDAIVNKNYLAKTAVRTPLTKVPIEYLTYLDLILNSNILFDEDVSYLYGYTVDLISDFKGKKPWDILWKNLIGFPFVATVIGYNSLIQVDHFFNLYSAVKLRYDNWNRRKSLIKLISTVKEIHLYFKKSLRILYEENACLKLQNLKDKATGKKEDTDSFVKKKKTEIDTLCFILCQCIIDVVCATRVATDSLLKQLPLTYPIDSKVNYFAFRTDEQLGLDNYSNSTTDTSVSINFDGLKNVYLLIQSEFFLRLGLSFCPTLWSVKEPLNNLKSTFDIVNRYCSSCEKNLSVIKYYYKKHVFPEVLKSNKLQDSNIVDGYWFIHKICTSFSNLIKDSRVLEEHVENLDHLNDSNIDMVCNRLERLKKDLGASFDSVIQAEKYFFKLRRCKDTKVENNENESKGIDNVPELSQSIELGKISQNVDSKDRVFFAIADNVNNEESSNIEPPLNPVKFPNYLMTELKEALVEKRNEFLDRENKAVENSEEYEKFLNTPEIEDKKETKQQRVQFLVENSRVSDLTMHKMLASAVAQRSHSFVNRCEEQFGSSDESDSS